jgi:uncharacterized protein (DUF2236 family)
MSDFVAKDSIARAIWGDADLVLLVFAGAAAEFALNRAVDWLFFTGAIPRDPVGRLLSTAGFASEIVFADEHAARQTIAKINGIHRAVERARGQAIPEWAYRDVLYMLVDYSERSFELLRRPLLDAEREELYAVYRRIAELMHIPAVAANYGEWRLDRQRHMERDLVCSPYTAKLYTSYRRQLGAWRYRVLLQLQAVLVPDTVRELLALHFSPMTRNVCRLLGSLHGSGLRTLLRRLILPAKYLSAINRLDRGTDYR